MYHKSVKFFSSFVIGLSLLSCGDSETVNPVGIGLLSGDGGNCLPIVVSGTYQKGKALDASNYVTIEINAIQGGSYVISTDEVNGYSFSASGIFTSPGPQNVALKGSGTPVNNQADIFTVTFGDSSCTFNISVKISPEDNASKVIFSTGEPFFSDYAYTYALDGNGNVLWKKEGFSAVVAAENDVVYLNGGGNLYAVNVLTGATIWADTSTATSYDNAIAISQNVLYTTSGSYGRLYAISAITGDTLWTYRADTYATTWSAPTVADGVIYFGSPDEHIYAINTDGTLNWKYFTDAGDVRSSPAVYNNTVYCAADNGILYAVNATTGALAWNTDVGVTGEQSPTISNDKLYIQGSSKIYCLNPTGGAVIWEYTIPEGDSEWSSPTENNGVLYAVGINQGLQAFDAATGSVLWNNKSFGTTSNGSPTVFDGVVYVAAPGGLTAVDAMTGATLWNYGDIDPWNPGNSVVFYTSPVVYDTETKTTGYPSDSGNKQ